MEMSKRTHIKNMRYEDFKDNEYLEQYVEELRKGGAPVVVTRLSDMINWGRSHSVWPLTFATSCCGSLKKFCTLILRSSCIIPYRMASGRGGHPGT